MGLGTILGGRLSGRKPRTHVGVGLKTKKRRFTKGASADEMSRLAPPVRASAALTERARCGSVESPFGLKTGLELRRLQTACVGASLNQDSKWKFRSKDGTLAASGARSYDAGNDTAG